MAPIRVAASEESLGLSRVEHASQRGSLAFKELSHPSLKIQKHVGKHADPYAPITNRKANAAILGASRFSPRRRSSHGRPGRLAPQPVPIIVKHSERYGL